MRTFPFLFAATLLLSAPGCAQQSDAGNEADPGHQVRLVQAERFNAMIAVDTLALARILADDLTYTHTTGRTETKAEFLSTLRSHTIQYESITPKDVQVRIYGDAAVVTGESAMRLTARDQALSFSIRFIEVYRQTAGSWQLVAWQSTRLAD